MAKDIEVGNMSPVTVSANSSNFTLATEEKIGVEVDVVKDFLITGTRDAWMTVAGSCVPF